MDQPVTHAPADALADRRAFVRLGAAAAAAGAAAALSAGRADAQAGQGLPNLYPTWNARQFQGIRDHENAHVAAVTALIQSLGGTPRPKPNFRNLLQPNVRQFGVTSRLQENTGVGAYVSAAPAIFSRQVLAAAGSIALIEARHAGYLNVLFNRLLSENVFDQEQDFERPLTVAEVVKLASPFIQDLNGGPPLAFNPADPSRENDIAILNFALALEFLESEFYNLNVPVFFPPSRRQ